MSDKPSGNIGCAINFDMTGYSDLKRRLKLRREKLGISQIDLAKKIGVTKSTIQNYEYGTPPKGDNIVKLAQVLRCKVAWLLNGEWPEDEEVQPPKMRIANGNQGIACREKEKFKKQEASSGNKCKSDSDQPNLTQVVIEHQDIIRRFKDPDKAKEFNEFLVNIEDGDPEGYDGLFKEAKIIYKTIKRLKRQLGNYSAPDSETIQKEDRRKKQRPERLTGQKNEKNGTSDQ